MLAASTVACHIPGKSIASNYNNVDQFNFDVAQGPKNYHIEGYLTRSAEMGKRPGLLVLNGGEGNVDQCVKMSQGIAAMGIQVACVSIPGYGNSSGPSRFVGQPSVLASRKALDMLAGRTDVDSSRLAVWGLGHGAVAAGLLMDYDSRPRALILESGCYDPLTLWPEAPLRTKLSILREVWPSKRILKERSVIAHLPPKLECSVLIMHGAAGQSDAGEAGGHARRRIARARRQGRDLLFPDRRRTISASASSPNCAPSCATTCSAQPAPPRRSKRSLNVKPSVGFTLPRQG